MFEIKLSIYYHSETFTLILVISFIDFFLSSEYQIQLKGGLIRDPASPIARGYRKLCGVIIIFAFVAPLAIRKVIF